MTPASESTPLKAEPAWESGAVSSRWYVARTSSAVMGLPLANLTPWRSLYVHSLPSSFGFQLTASSGASVRFWRLRLRNSPEMPPSCSAAVSWYVHGSSVPLGIGVRPTRMRPPALPRVSFANATGASPAATSAADITGTARPNMVARWMKPARSHSPARRSSTTAFWGSLASPRQASKRLRVSRSMPCSLLVGVGAEVRRTMVRRSWPARQSVVRGGALSQRPANLSSI